MVIKQQQQTCVSTYSAENQIFIGDELRGENTKNYGMSGFFIVIEKNPRV